MAIKESRFGHKFFIFVILFAIDCYYWIDCEPLLSPLPDILPVIYATPTWARTENFSYKLTVLYP
jgi:hypothetical protein